MSGQERWASKLACSTLAANDIAAVEDVDRAWMVMMKTRMGPFGILDVVSLETAWHITQYWATHLSDKQLQTNADFSKATLTRAGWG